MFKDYIRDIPALDAKTESKIWKLTSAQWSVYYWLLANSNRKPDGSEKHYYIYRNAFTFSEIQRDTGVRSANTVKAALAKLIEQERIRETVDSFGKTVYLIFPVKPYVPCSARVIRTLLRFNKYVNVEVSITILAIVARMLTLDNLKHVALTKTEIGALIGMAKQNIDEAGVAVALGLLKELQLIDYQVSIYQNKFKTNCRQYLFTKVNLNGDHLVDYWDSTHDTIREDIVEMIGRAVMDED